MTHFAISWHRRLESRVLIATTLIVGLSLGAVLVATRKVVTSYSLDRSSQDLVAARAAFDRLIETRKLSAAKTARLVVDLPTFREPLTNPEVAADAATISLTAEDFRGKLGATFCVITNKSGAWIGTAGSPAESPQSSGIAAAVSSAQAGRPASNVVSVGDRLFLVVSEPAMFASEIVGTFTAGFALDDAVATDLALVTNSDVNFLCPHLCGSSLSGGPRAALAALVAGNPAGLGGIGAAPDLRQIGSVTYVSGVYPLRTDAAGAAAMVLLKDWAPTEAALARIHDALLTVGAVTFGLVLFGALAFSRRLTRPIRDLANAAGDIANGQWVGHVPERGPAETRRMASAFNHMRETLSHWHKEATSRAGELQTAYERFRAVTDSASDAIVSVNALGEIVFWNLRAEKVFGYSEQESLGQPLTMILPERTISDYASAFGRLASDSSAYAGETIQTSGRRRDGTELPVELALSTWRAGREVFFTGIVRDITERRQAAIALQEREAQLRQAQKMEAVGRLAGGVAHDFNNLLTAILGYCDLLLERLPPGDATRLPIGEIAKAGRSAASLTRDLLAFSRKQVLQPVVLDFNKVVENTDSLLRRLVGEDVQIELDLAATLHRVKADPGQVSQVLLNLAVNARDAMPNGGRLTISTRNANAGDVLPRTLEADFVLLTVADTGCGMSDSVRTHIFEPFFTTKDVGMGTGLGLATVEGIVEQSGGHVWVDSAPGAGTTFFLAFPATSEGIEFEEAVPDLVTPAAHRHETVVLVEDNDAVRALAHSTLTSDGYQVLEAVNGAEALTMVQDRLAGIALVLTDVVMPVMGGRELVTRLRAIRPDIRVVFTSGYASDPETADHARVLGAGFIQKPFVPSALRRLVRAAIDAPLQSA